MIRFKKTLKLLGLVIFILLASIGIGLSGGVPIPITNSKKENIEFNIQLEESKDDDSETVNFNEVK